METRMKSLFLLLVTGLVAFAQVETLPAPVVHGNSFEILSNSRYSFHSGFTSTLPTQVLANVLWAMSRVPRLGAYREIYVATPSNVYLYDDSSHTITVHLSGNHRYSANSAFEVGVACERYEEAGYAIQAGLLAGVAFWDSAGGTVTTCPMQFATNYANSNWNPNHTIRMVNVYGQGSARGLVRTVQAVSSDSSLPLPDVVGTDSFEVLLATLHQDTVFDPANLPLEKISQLLWAAYGVTPHTASGGNRGTTIPSAVARYYLTRKIYLVRDVGVDLYHNRLPPGTNLTTSDHRLQLVTSGDRRPQLRAACPRIPSTAPVYIIVTVRDTSLNYSMLEAGFAGFQLLMQANALGLQGSLTAPLLPAERSAVIQALGIPDTNLPVIVFSTGEPVVGVDEGMGEGRPALAVARVKGGVRLTYRLVEPAVVGFVIYDLAGRPVRTWPQQPQPAGRHVLEWNGSDDRGARLPDGVYLCRLTASGAKSHQLSARITLIH
ncbi:MAG: FlgD immunoglobulin-like domain containing protein [candidate division WOR-3 bacterium]